MANEIHYNHSNNTDYLYALIRNLNGELLKTDNSTFVVYPASGSLSNYAIGDSTPDNGFLWKSDFPEELSSGAYIIQIKKREGGSPDYSDSTISSFKAYWNGSFLSETNPEIIITNNADNLESIITNENSNKDLIIADNGTNTEAILTAIDTILSTPPQEINIEVGHSSITDEIEHTIIKVETGVN